MRHPFTDKIDEILKKYFADDFEQIFKNSELLQYINIKTKSANRGSKSRSSFGNLYAIYVLLEDYISNGFDKKSGYSEFAGAKFSDLFKGHRELSFGAKLQNHALNHRMNEEFKKFFPTCEFTPIIRVVATNRYWFNENLINITANKQVFNISHAILEIVDAYVEVKRGSFEKFIDTCEKLKELEEEIIPKTSEFVLGLLAPNVDARVFEIVSFAILKFYYFDQTVFFGFDLDEIEEENLKLYKTGRTNANDGGIDFVMKPLGRFFQVTETTDVKKYFLDIDKLEKFPITFVVKSIASSELLLSNIRTNAEKQYSIKAVVDKYISCIEEIINIQELTIRFNKAVELGYLNDILSEIITQSKVEFNYEEYEDEDEDNEVAD
ncbi:MAG: restriction endonuclease [Flavobacteriales bacterium CG_4_9_14_3_um_filter_40_17]|nr:MAG: restriction endonuclease [Bacteroidetes bacterium CG18_big_fil_WC_8_21_14_2_50_41_14]PJB13724.1 MAG: restriction endonuclease [Flavobacteriales bacterium CG_4_9_14_3_um_filter_40_17]